MIFINNILHLEYNEFVSNEDVLNCDVPEGTYKALRSRGKIATRGIEGQGNRAFIEFESLPVKYKAIVVDVFGNPYEYVGSQKIKEHLVVNNQDAQYLKQFQFGDGLFLPKNTIDELIEASTYLWLLHRAAELKKEHGAKAASAQLGVDSFKTFNANICTLIQNEKVKLPSAYTRLTEKRKKYSSAIEQGIPGASILISKKWGTQNALKLENKDMKGYLSQLMAHPNNLPHTLVAEQYNQVARTLGMKEITARRVSQLRYAGEQRAVTLTGTRGIKQGLQKIAIQNKRKSSSHALSYITTDGWDVELSYQDRISYSKDGKTKEKQVYGLRHTIVVVLDVFNKYPIGYAIGDRETPALIAAAFKNAMDHIAELTGGLHKMWQIQSDNYGRGALTPLYTALSSEYTPATVGNAKAKVIEPWFKWLSHRWMLQPNWSGHNITASAENQPNADFHNDKNVKKAQPTKEENIYQIHQLMADVRAEKVDEWVESWKSLGAQEKLPFSSVEYLETFGKSTGSTCRLRGEGLIVSIDGEKTTYDTHDLEFRKYGQVDWKITYDAENTDSVLVTSQDQRIKFILDKKHVQPMERRLQTETDKLELKTVKSANKEIEQTIAATHQSNNDASLSLYEKMLEIDPSAAEMMMRTLPQFGGIQKDFLAQAKRTLGTPKTISINAHDLSDDEVEQNAISNI